MSGQIRVDRSNDELAGMMTGHYHKFHYTLQAIGTFGTLSRAMLRTINHYNNLLYKPHFTTIIL